MNGWDEIAESILSEYAQMYWDQVQREQEQEALFCTWPLDNGEDCGEPIPDDQNYCEMHAHEALAIDEEMRELNLIAREWREYRTAGDETPPWKVSR